MTRQDFELNGIETEQIPSNCILSPTAVNNTSNIAFTEIHFTPLKKNKQTASQKFVQEIIKNVLLLLSIFPMQIFKNNKQSKKKKNDIFCN
jgi:hypothetical protein